MSKKPQIGARYWKGDLLNPIITITEIDERGNVHYEGRGCCGSMPVDYFDLKPVEDCTALRQHRDGLNIDLAQATLEAEALRQRVEKLEGALAFIDLKAGNQRDHVGDIFDVITQAARAVLAEGKPTKDET